MEKPVSSLGEKSKFAILEDLIEEGELRGRIEELRQKLRELPGPSGNGEKAHSSREAQVQKNRKSSKGQTKDPSHKEA